MTWHSLPLFVRLQGRPVILFGEGEAADAKRRLLERAGAMVVEEHRDARLAIVAIEDEQAAVAAVARLRARGLLVNTVDRPSLCDFTIPAIVDRDPVLVAIGTGGVSAGLAAALRQRLEALLPARLGGLADALDGARAALRARFPDAGERRRAIGAAFAAGQGLDPFGAASAMVAGWPPPKRPELVARQVAHAAEKGEGALACFSLTSADPDDLTLRQARALAQADRLFHTAAVPAAILDRARADAPRILSATPPGARGPGLTVWLDLV